MRQKDAATLTKAFDFLTAQLNGKAAFTKEDVTAAVGWSRKSVGDYFSKKLRNYVTTSDRGKTYAIAAEFSRLTLDQFLAHMSQVTRAPGYWRWSYEHIVQYEFLLPLTREDNLRDALDELFYKDTLEQLVREMNDGQLDDLLPAEAGETDTDHVQRAVRVTSRLFGGYSISHVRGRFRASSEVKDRSEVGQLLVDRERYLIDETTAVVRFIIPFETGKTEHGETFDVDSGVTVHQAEGAPEVMAELRRIRGIFFAIFVEAVVKTIKGEDVIWLLENSPQGQRLYELAKA